MHAWRLPVQYNIVYIVYCIYVTSMRRAGVRRSLQSCLPPRYCDVSAGQCARVQHDNNNIIAFTSSSSSSNYTAAAGGVRIASSAVRVRARAASLCGSCVRASAIPWVVARVRVRECAECSTIILLPSDFSVWVRAHRPSSALLNAVIAVLLFTRCSIDRDRIPDVRSRSLFCFRVPCTPPPHTNHIPVPDRVCEEKRRSSEFPWISVASRLGNTPPQQQQSARDRRASWCCERVDKLDDCIRWIA